MGSRTVTKAPLQAGRRRVLAFLRRPAVIVTEVVTLAVSTGLAASLPQQPDADDVERFASEWPALGRVVRALGLHEILTSSWFLAVVAMCLLSLVAVQSQQWPRVRRLWRTAPDETAFARAPYRLEAPLARAREIPPSPRLRTRGRLGLLGSPVFHLGLLVVVSAGILRLLFSREAVTRMVEGEVLPSGPGAFVAERGGWLSTPITLRSPLRLDGIRVERYASGALQQIAMEVTILADAPQSTRVAINAPLDLPGTRLYVTNDHGTAVLLERARAAGADHRIAWLVPRDDEDRGRLRLEDGVELRFRARRAERERSVEMRSVEMRSLRGGTLQGVADLAAGTSVQIGAGDVLRVVAVLPWVEVRASRDPSRPLFFAGVVIGILGVVLMFGFNRVDEGVFVQGDRLVVALRPARFAPLYSEEFERLCQAWVR